MFFLVTGASGVGKSTVRQLIEPEFARVLETAELAMLGDTPEWNIAWRHRLVDQMVQHALTVERRGKHFLFCGDPVPPGEVWAAPSAHQLNHLAVCLLDASESAQTARLLARGEDPSLIPRHLAFADWMRHHVLDHTYRPQVITQNAWPGMCWERWVGSAAGQTPWTSHIIDTSEQSPAEVVHLVAQWLYSHIGKAAG
jgi:hypothetical protein